MTIRTFLAEAAHRAYNTVARCTVTKVDDKKKMQIMDISVLANEKMTGIEHMQPYGFSMVVADAEQGQANQQQQDPFGMQDGQSQSGTGQGRAAEGVVIFVNGDRAHPIVIMVDDRRHRIKGLKPGEVAVYHSKKHQLHMTDDGIFGSVPHDKKVQWRIMPDDKQQGGGNKLTAAEGGGGTSTGQQDGQEPWVTKQPYAWHEMTRDGYTVKHPKKIEHHIVDESGKTKYSMAFDDQGKFTAKFTDVSWDKAT